MTKMKQKIVNDTETLKAFKTRSELCNYAADNSWRHFPPNFKRFLIYLSEIGINYSELPLNDKEYKQQLAIQRDNIIDSLFNDKTS